jgi:hypothetical protein
MTIATHFGVSGSRRSWGRDLRVEKHCSFQLHDIQDLRQCIQNVLSSVSRQNEPDDLSSHLAIRPFGQNIKAIGKVRREHSLHNWIRTDRFEE